MNKMLSEALREYHGLREQLDRALLGDNAEEWGKKFRALMRGEPVNTEGMIYIPLEISEDLGEVALHILKDCICRHQKKYIEGGDWRLPTYKEMQRLLEAGKLKDWVYYFTSESEGFGLRVLRRHNAGLGSSNSRNERSHLCLVREVKIPGQE